MKKKWMQEYLCPRLKKVFLLMKLTAIILMIAVLQVNANDYLKPEVKDIKLIVRESITQGQQGEKLIKGTVTDEDGAPLPGVTVLVKGTTIGTITNADGKYALDVPVNAKILAFSFVGMKTVEQAINGQSVISVMLKNEAIGLDEVVAVGYGTQKKVNLTGSVATIKSEELVKVPAANVSEILAGKTPGLMTKQSSGLPGDDATSLSIRGFGSPLVLVDGVEMSLNRLDPNEIESVSILKDAAAAIYGVRAGDGVILVTTKRGQSGKPTITYNGNMSVQQPTVIPKFVNSWEFAELMREGESNYGLPNTWTEEDIQKFKAGTDPNYPNQNWYDAIFVNWAPMQSHNLSVRGGSEKIKYYMSVGYLDQESLFTSGDWNFQRYNTRSNVDMQITNDLSVSLDLSYNREQRNEPFVENPNDASLIDDVWLELSSAQPVFSAYLPDTKIGSPYSGFIQRNPLAKTNADFSGFRDDRRETFTGKLSFKYAVPFVKGLSAKGELNFSSYNRYRKDLQKPYDVVTYDYDTETYTKVATSGRNKLDENFDKAQKIYPLISLVYDNKFGNHEVNGLLLGEYIDTEDFYISASRIDLLSLNIPYLFAGSSTNILNNGKASESGRSSIVGRANYSYKGKYLLEASFRYDGSYKFPKGSRWGFFPSISAGWRLSEESFMAGADWLDNLKIRLSYSQSGKDNVDPFKFLTGYEIRTGANEKYQIGNALGSIITSTGLPNPNITWLDMTTYNTGVDASFFDGLIGIEMDLFYRLRENVFGTPMETYPSTFGATLPQLNINSTDNRGFELVLTHRNKIRDFNYNVALNFGIAREKYKKWAEESFEDPDEIRIYQKTGNWTNRWFGYMSDGLFLNQAEIDNHPVNQDQNGNSTLRPGDIKYKDISGSDGKPDGVINWRDQAEIGYGTFPDMSYGLNLNAEYKGINISVLLQGASMFNMQIGGNLRAPFTTGSVPFDYHYKYRAKLSDDHTGIINPDQAIFPIISTQGSSANNNKNSDYWIEDNTYLRLKNLNISYNLPNRLLKSTGASAVKVYVSGGNLFSFNRLGIYKSSFDPESSFTYPPVRTLTLGVNITL